MDLAQSLDLALGRMLAEGRVEVRENGAWLAALEGFRYEVRPHHETAVLHLWSEQRDQVRCVNRIVSEQPDRLTIEVSRLGRPRRMRLEFLAARRKPAEAKLKREWFRIRLQDLLAQRFPDDAVDSLTVSADLEHSISGSYARGVMSNDSHCWAFLAAAPDERSGIYDGLLTFGLIWLDQMRRSASNRPVAGLRLLSPEGSGRATAHRLAALAQGLRVEFYEYSPQSGRTRAIDPRDAGNIESWLAPRRETEAILEAAALFVSRVRHQLSGAVESHVVPGSHEVELRYFGLPFARWRQDGIFFGTGDRQQPLSSGREVAFEKLLRDLETRRSPAASDTKHPLYRARPERWLESMVAADPGRVNAMLDPRFVYAQVPAISIGDRGVMDLIGVTREGRLTVLELKAQEDIQMPLQAVDYWLRVRWHHLQEDFSRYGYFPGITLDPRPPRLLLIAPSLRFHPATDVILRHLNPQIEIERIGLSEHWRRGLRVVLRQGRPNA